MSSAASHRVVVSRHGGPEVLQLVDDRRPEPAWGMARVRVLAAGVSGFDLIYRRWGRLPGSPTLPFSPGEDVVGVVDAVGPGVSALRTGQVVAGGTWTLGVGGGYTEYLCLPEPELVPVPDGVDAAEAVCLVVNYLTAHQHLHGIGQARCGQRLLVHGAAGGVGTALLDLGRLAGMEMYGTASASGHDVVDALGATPIDYRTEDVPARIRELTGTGVDLVVDVVGGARHLAQSYRVLRRDGRLVWLGSAAVAKHGLAIGLSSMLMSSSLRMIPDGKHVPRCPTLDKHAAAHPGWYRDTLSELLGLLATGRLTPKVAARVPLAEASRAHALLERGGHAGKFVLVTEGYEQPDPAGPPARSTPEH